MEGTTGNDNGIGLLADSILQQINAANTLQGIIHERKDNHGQVVLAIGPRWACEPTKSEDRGVMALTRKTTHPLIPSWVYDQDRDAAIWRNEWKTTNFGRQHRHVGPLIEILASMTSDRDPDKNFTYIKTAAGKEIWIWLQKSHRVLYRYKNQDIDEKIEIFFFPTSLSLSMTGTLGLHQLGAYSGVTYTTKCDGSGSAAAMAEAIKTTNSNVLLIQRTLAMNVHRIANTDNNINKMLEAFNKVDQKDDLKKLIGAKGGKKRTIREIEETPLRARVTKMRPQNWDATPIRPPTTGEDRKLNPKRILSSTNEAGTSRTTERESEAAKHITCDRCGDAFSTLMIMDMHQCWAKDLEQNTESNSRPKNRPTNPNPLRAVRKLRSSGQKARKSPASARKMGIKQDDTSDTSDDTEEIGTDRVTRGKRSGNSQARSENVRAIQNEEDENEEKSF